MIFFFAPGKHDGVEVESAVCANSISYKHSVSRYRECIADWLELESCLGQKVLLRLDMGRLRSVSKAGVRSLCAA